MTKKQSMENTRHNSNVFWAVILILGGGILLAHSFGLLEMNIDLNLISWKLIPLFIGLNALNRKNYFNAIVCIGLAIIFYIPEFLTVTQKAQYYKLWPLLLIVAGLLILFRYMYPKEYEELGNHTISTDQIDEMNIMAGSSHKIISENFKGGHVNCFMGGAEIDLLDVTSNNTIYLKTFVMMGGLALKIPKEWNVKIDVMPIMGGVEDQITKFPANTVSQETLMVITGNVIMGGIDIKRF